MQFSTRTLGEPGVEGRDDKHFGRPTDIAWLPDGTFFVSDGYTNTRVVKFDKNGKYLMAWGKPDADPKHQTYGGRTQKFHPKPGADPSKLIGVPVPLMPKAGS